MNGKSIIKCGCEWKDWGPHPATPVNAGLKRQCLLGSAARPGVLPPFACLEAEEAGLYIVQSSQSGEGGCPKQKYRQSVEGQ